ncbi:multidrug resistance-associated protein 7-like isoform X2 [Rhinatrema bivittatum]|uniref:multidrug resistance-associated protein 7-like isoform X2 n=1 Tax=Rhinatrema bivittatum TaxID=194408 RepID=UPI00112A794B|nr:multidrug resistance-associated protein 7-like isoform X2 [Rhinatrema bivittatum]
MQSDSELLFPHWHRRWRRFWRVSAVPVPRTHSRFGVHGSVGHCFNRLVLNTLPHAVLAVTSACYVGSPRFPGYDNLSRPSWKCRILVSFLFAVLSLADIILAAVFPRQGTVSLEVLAGATSALAWITHGLALLMLLRSVHGLSRGPLALVLLALLPLPTLVISVLSYCQSWVSSYALQPASISRLTIACLQLACLAVYVLASIAPVPSRRDFDSINDASERAPLLSGAGSPASDAQIVGEDGESWLSRFFYLWLNPLLKHGYQKKLKQPQDVYLLPHKLQTRAVFTHFSNCWQAKMAAKVNACNFTKSDGRGRPLSSGLAAAENDPEKKVSLLSVLHSTFGLRYYSLGLLKLGGSMLSFAGPLLLNSLVNFMETREEPLSLGILYAVGLFASSFLGALLCNQFTYEVDKVVIMVRAAVISSIYQKSLRVNGTTLSRFSTGEIVNFMSIDTENVITFCTSFHEVWSLPFQFLVSAYLLYLQMGVSSLGGLGLILLLAPINKYVASRIMESRIKMMEHKDSRIKLLTEILRGMRVIKFYTWEKHFMSRVSHEREKELRMLKIICYLDAACDYLWDALPVLISILTFMTYVLLGHQLTAAKVFTALALIGMLIFPLNMFPWMVTQILQAKVSVDRIQRFLELSDQDLDGYYSGAAASDPDTVLELNQSTFSWLPLCSDSTDHPLSREEPEQRGSLETCIHHLAVKKGTLLGVVGKVGCGKSSLLAAITGELNRKDGRVRVVGLEQGFGLVVQEPWIQFASVRENILFGRGLRSRFYQEVLEACALLDDLKIFPAGDQTLVGENGVTLSGGQRARVALARAVYQNKEIYLLDDPLAAVDADVASHIMEKCILGILGQKTRILCTHRLEVLDKADLLVLMDEGKIVQTGTPSEILPQVETTLKHQTEERERKEESTIGRPKEMHGMDEEQEAEEYGHEHLGGVHPSDVEEREPEKDSHYSVHAEDEARKEGAVAFQVYRSYWNAVGSGLACLTLLAFFLMQASENISAWWMSYWISNLRKKSKGNASMIDFSPQLLLFSPGSLVRSKAPAAAAAPRNSSSDVNFYLMVYGCIVAVNSILTISRAFLFAYGIIRASTVIHKRLLSRVLMATVLFFDTTPIGRIINRFSSDMEVADESLPYNLNMVLVFIFALLGMVVIISYGLPWIILVMVPLTALYFYIQWYYRHTSRELKRLNSITLSPIYTHFSETLTGLHTIRATRATDRFEQENEVRLERNQRCLFISNTAMQWLDIRLQMIGVVVVTAISVIAIIQHQRESGDPGLVGLALSYALSITFLLSELISKFTHLETMMVSVERAEEYSTEIPKEPEDGIIQVAPDWPSEGHVEFRNVGLAYRAGLPNALDGVNFTIAHGEKVGIVGRTGSGKSTMFLALFRMIELNGGQIFINNVDIRLVALEELSRFPAPQTKIRGFAEHGKSGGQSRSDSSGFSSNSRCKLAIIPQDPFLFSGSVRENLDPWGRHEDVELYQVLEQVHLKEAITRMGGLDSEVGESGRSLSVGQRQLVCLARALLTQAKLLCIDEATASVDQKTDRLLQQTIRERFAEKTVLTIAHRLNTIMDSDRVLVMEAGRAVELDSPRVLCNNPESSFYRLIQSGEQ